MLARFNLSEAEALDVVRQLGTLTVGLGGRSREAVTLLSRARDNKTAFKAARATVFAPKVIMGLELVPDPSPPAAAAAAAAAAQPPSWSVPTYPLLLPSFMAAAPLLRGRSTKDLRFNKQGTTPLGAALGVLFRHDVAALPRGMGAAKGYGHRPGVYAIWYVRPVTGVATVMGPVEWPAVLAFMHAESFSKAYIMSVTTGANEFSKTRASSVNDYVQFYMHVATGLALFIAEET